MTIEFDKILISSCETYHCYEGNPLYNNRFTAVLKFANIGLAAVKDNSGSYHIQINGKPAYKLRFDKSYGFYCNRAAVSIDDEYFHIDINGKRIYKTSYEWVGNYQENLCVVRKKDQYYHIDINGDPVYKERYDYVGDFKDGIAVVYKSNSATHINNKGEYIHNQWFKQLDIYHKGYARAEEISGWLHIDKTGNPLYESRYKNVEHFYNDLARVETFDGNIFQINIKDQIIHRLNKEDIRVSEAQLSSDMVDFWKIFIINAAIKLNIFEYLPSTTDGLVKNLKAPKDNLIRILRALWELNLVFFDENHWYSTSKGNFLSNKSKTFFPAAAIMWAKVADNGWLNLPNLLQNPKISSHQSFKDNESDDYNLQNYYKALEGYAIKDLTNFIEKFNFSNKEIICFGRSGLGFFRYLLKKQPNLNITALLENKIPKDYLQTSDIKTITNLNSLDHKYDIAFLLRYLHYFDDEGVVEYLKKFKYLNISELIIFETILQEDSSAGGLLDVNMMIETGGRLRTIKDWNKLLSKNGYKIKQQVKITSYLTLIKANLSQ